MSSQPVDAFFESADGTRLHYQWHQPVDPQAVVVFLHGYGDHGARYGELAASLDHRDIAVLALDYRGHGAAQGQRGYCVRFDDYLADLESACALARGRVPGAPLGLIGHSHGGLITLRALCDPGHSAYHVPAVLSSPFLKLRRHTHAAKVWLGHLASRVAPRLALRQGIPATDMTHDSDVLEAGRRDRLTHGWATARWFTESRQAQRYVADHVQDLTAPTLWLVSTADPVSDPSTNREVYARAGGQKSLRIYEDFYHELFHEVGREHVFADVQSWLGENLPRR